MVATRIPQSPAALLLPRRIASHELPFLPLPPTSSSLRRKKVSSVAASARPPPQQPKNRSSFPFLPQEDVEYLWGLAAASVAGAAAVKYGSALLPEITRPSLAQALVIIGLPMVISVLLLIKGSFK